MVMSKLYTTTWYNLVDKHANLPEVLHQQLPRHLLLTVNDIASMNLKVLLAMAGVLSIFPELPKSMEREKVAPIP